MPTFESLKKGEVYICFKYPNLFIFSKGTDSSEIADTEQIKEVAGKNVTTLIIHNYRDLEGYIHYVGIHLFKKKTDVITIYNEYHNNRNN